jgi:hypothetical protein
MSLTLAPKRERHRDPFEPGAGALMFFSLVAASGFAVGWLIQTGAGF